MQENCAKQGLQPLEAFIGKIIQLYEMIVVRHGLMLVGLSYGMKTAAHKVLAAALSDLHAKVFTLTCHTLLTNHFGSSSSSSLLLTGFPLKMMKT